MVLLFWAFGFGDLVLRFGLIADIFLGSEEACCCVLVWSVGMLLSEARYGESDDGALASAER